MWCSGLDPSRAGRNSPSHRTACNREARVIVDHRTYKVRPGTLGQQLAIYEKFALPVQLKHLGKPLAFLTAETGELNTLIHLWAYESAADREQKRAAMSADPAWGAYLKANAEAGYLVDMRTNLMVPASFAPIQR
jgi:hypothetical protein